MASVGQLVHMPATCSIIIKSIITFEKDIGPSDLHAGKISAKAFFLPISFCLFIHSRHMLGRLIKPSYACTSLVHEECFAKTKHRESMPEKFYNVPPDQASIYNIAKSGE